MRFIYSIVYIVVDIAAKIVGAAYSVSALLALGASLYGVEVMLDALPAFGQALAPAWGPFAVMPMLGAGIGAALTIPLLSGVFVLVMKLLSDAADAVRAGVLKRLERTEAEAAVTPAPTPAPAARNRKVASAQPAAENVSEAPL